MRQNYIFILFLLLFSIISCNNERRKEKRILDELERGKINSLTFSKSFENKANILASKNSEELTNIASGIYAHIGTPVSKQDTQRLNIAIEYINKALILSPLNKSAYQNKLNILISMQEWEKLLDAINCWIEKGNPTYYDNMLKGFVYRKIGMNDSSNVAFKTALFIFEENRFKDDDVNNRIQKAIIVSFLYGKNRGIQEMNTIIDDTEDKDAIIIRNTIFNDFDEIKYIDKYVLKREEKLHSTL